MAYSSRIIRCFVIFCSADFLHSAMSVRYFCRSFSSRSTCSRFSSSEAVFHRCASTREISALLNDGWSRFTSARLACEYDKKADMGRFGAFGSLLLRCLAGTFHGPVYNVFSTSYRALSFRASSSYRARSSAGSSFHAFDTSFAIVVVCSYEHE